MSLIGFRYVQSTDPGAVGAGHQWENTTTGDIFERNSGNTAWTFLYNCNLANGGLVPKTGAVMSGPLTGVTGWAPNDSPNFTTTAKLNGVNLATTNDLTTLRDELVQLIKVDAQIAVANALGGLTGNQNVAIGSGNLVGATKASPITIPLPSFPDGIKATEAQFKWLVAPSYDTKTGDSGNNLYIY